MLWTRARARQAPGARGPDLHGLGSRAPGGSGCRSSRCRWGGSLLHLALVVVLSVGSYFFCSRFVYTTVEIRGVSMYPNLVPGDRFVLNLWRHLFQAPQRGELVVIRDPVHGDFAVKRVIGLPRETIQMRRNIAYVDGRRLVEPYLPAAAVASEDAVMERGFVVPEGRYFVLGDNRGNSEDSRRYGAVPRQNIFGTIRLAGQLQSFLRPISSAAVDRSSPLPLPRIPVAASERKEPADP